MADTPEAALPVEQSDRDAACEHFCFHPATTGVEVERMENGEMDEHRLVQAFARHRIAHTRPAVSEATGEALARRFHETYERLAPSFGYETRKESAKPWADVPDQNKRLMIAVCGEILAALQPPVAGVTREAMAYDDRVAYEKQILSLEMELMKCRAVLIPFATKACGWEQNHSHTGRDSQQISHRLGDFRAARAQLLRLDRINEGLVERPFAYCCAEGGGRIEGCSCVNKDHGTAWFARAALATGQGERG